MRHAAILDSGIVIGIFDKGDQFYNQAKSIFEEFEKRNISTFYTTDYVAVECSNFLLRKVSPKSALQALRLLFETDGIRMIFVDPGSKKRLIGIMEKFPGLSFTDASLIFISESVGIKTMYSFDKGFDKVKGVIRKDRVQNV